MLEVDIVIDENLVDKKMFDLSKVLEGIAKGLTDIRVRRIDNQVDYNGNPLPELSAYTIKLKGNAVILVDTGIMRDSIGYIKVNDNLYYVDVIDAEGKDRMLLSIEGDESQNRPKRNIWGPEETDYINDDDLRIINEVITEYARSLG